MLQIMKSELDRFWKVGTVAALVHLIFWQVILSKEQISSLHWNTAKVALAIAGIAAAALGFYQIGSLKKAGTWTFLIHRPLAPWKIFAALVGAGFIWLAGVVALPTGLSILYADIGTQDLVDGRHYGLPLMLLGASWFIYTVALLTRLSPSWASFLAIALMPFFATTKAAGWSAGAALTLMLVVVMALAAAHFKADLESPSRSGLVNAGMAMVVTYGAAVVLLWLTIVAYSLGVAFKEHGIMGPAKHSWNDYFPADSIDGTTYRTAEDLLEAGFARLGTESARALLPQIALAETADVVPLHSRFPRRHDPMYNHPQTGLIDRDSEVVWTFSHREMLLRGVHMQTEEEIGWLGPDGFMDTPGTPRFSSVPLSHSERFLVTPTAIFEVDFATRRITDRFQVPDGEAAAMDPVMLGTTTLVLTDQALYVFDRRRWRERFEASEPIARAELPARIGRLTRIQAAELMDGLLLSMIFNDSAGQGDGAAFQWLAEVSLNGDVVPTATLPLRQAVPDEVRFRGVTQSPINFALHTGLNDMLDARPDHWRHGDGFGFHLSPRAWRWMLICSLVAAFLAWTTGMRRQLPTKTRLIWVLWCLVAGPPGWLAMLFLTERPLAPPVAAPKKLGSVPALSAVTSSWSTKP